MGEGREREGVKGERAKLNGFCKTICRDAGRGRSSVFRQIVLSLIIKQTHPTVDEVTFLGIGPVWPSFSFSSPVSAVSRRP